MQPISVVVPVYNVENYLRKCVDSLLAQNYPAYEIVLVDDGAKDSSGSICDEYASVHENVRALHKKNGGLSDARNFGVREAKYDLVVFIDSDDYVSKEYLRHLYCAFAGSGADLAVTGAICVDEDGTEYARLGADDCSTVTAQEAIERMCYGATLPIYAWAKLYRKEHLLKHPYPIGRLHEDVGTTYLLLDECTSVCVDANKDYYYVRRKGSILHRGYSERMYYSIEASKEIISFLRNKYPAIVYAGYGRLALEANALMHRVVNDENYEQVRARVMHEFDGIWRMILTDKKIPYKIRLQLLLCKLNGALYKRSYKRMTGR